MSENDDADRCLSIWAVYDHPAELPTCFVAREWLVHRRGPSPITITDHVIVSDDLEKVRQALIKRGLIRLPRERDDDPKIMETWI